MLKTNPLTLFLMRRLYKNKLTYVTDRVKTWDADSTLPYVSGHTFRETSNHIIDDACIPFNPRHVQENDVIFLRTKYLRRFVKYMHYQIKKRYILVTHYGDEDVPGKYRWLLEDDKILHWFGVNATLLHPKLTTIPIGLGNAYRKSLIDALVPNNRANGQRPFASTTSTGDASNVPEGEGEKPKTPVNNQVNNERAHLLYLNFSEHTHPERTYVREYFSKQSFCTVQERIQEDEFFQELQNSKFALSPRGNGIDCHRTWECLHVGTIPVMKTTALDPLFEGLPVLIVKEWTEVTKNFLEYKYEEISSKHYTLDKLYMDYWIDLIQQAKLTGSYTKTEK